MQLELFTKFNGNFVYTQNIPEQRDITACRDCYISSYTQCECCNQWTPSDTDYSLDNVLLNANGTKEIYEN